MKVFFINTHDTLVEEIEFALNIKNHLWNIKDIMTTITIIRKEFFHKCSIKLSYYKIKSKNNIQSWFLYILVKWFEEKGEHKCFPIYYIEIFITISS